MKRGIDLDFRNMVKDENIWVSDKAIQSVPNIIKKEYELLKKSVYEDDVCGALFRLKDIYEISMKIPSIMAIISISSYVENDNDFIRMTGEELKKEHENFLLEKVGINIESEVLNKFGIVLSRLLREPLSIGGWKELIEIIVEQAEIFEIEDCLKLILERTINLLEVKPKKVGGESGRYENVSNWRNKTIGHGTLSINTDDYWEQAYDLIQGLFLYFTEEKSGVSLSELYGQISIELEEDREKLIIGEQEYLVSEFIYSLDDEHYFFDSYYSRQNYTEITNYLGNPRRLRNSTYYETLFSLYEATKKARAKKKGRKISNSIDREMYACLNSIPDYEKPVFVIEKIKNFIKENDKGLLYIQMERGMGKSTLAHRLDGRYQNGFLQKDLGAVVRVYHISDMLLRNDNRVRDYFTALNTNLISYRGGQLEIDNDEYYVEGKDLRKLMEGDENEASLAFCQYLELFRVRYEEEIDDEEEVNLVYIIDGIDEINSDTVSILNTIPDGREMQGITEELMNHVYIILLSRTKDEDNLPVIAKESIEICEKKANNVLTIDCNDSNYYQLLKKYIIRNYQHISDERVCEIIENAQRKFLYIQPYMAMGENVLKLDEKTTAYDVARSYIEELQKMYCGTSLHTLQLIVSSIAVFHSISLNEICKLVLFTKVSYDVIGVLNDILPLLASKRTDGEDTYSFANEEYEQFIYENMQSSVFEVICRYRISMVSWSENVDTKLEEYGKQWGDYVNWALVIDSVATKQGFYETTEEYVKCLIYLCERNNPWTFYSKIVNEDLKCDVLNQIRQLRYKKLDYLTKKDLSFIQLSFRKRDKWYRQSYELVYEYTQEIIQHCIENEGIDEWFQLIIDYRLSLKYVNSVKREKDRLDAFVEIVENRENKLCLIEYISNLIVEDANNNRGDSYGIYMEQILPIIEDETLRKKIYESLVVAYNMLAEEVKNNPRVSKIDDARRVTMLQHLLDAERYTDINNYDLIKGIEVVFKNENIYDDAIKKLDSLAENIQGMDPEDYMQELHRCSLNEDDLDENQVKNLYNALIRNYTNILEMVNQLENQDNLNQVIKWLSVCMIGNARCFTVENKLLLEQYLDKFSDIVKQCALEKNINVLWEIAFDFRKLLRQYDDIIRHCSIGLYRDSYWDRDVDEKQTMSQWERTYALYCSTIIEVEFRDVKDYLPIMANRFVDKLLQEQYEKGDKAEYDELIRYMEKSYKYLDFRNRYLFNCKYYQVKLVMRYYRWICVRYYRSLNGFDVLSSNELINWMKDEYSRLYEYVFNMVSNESDLIHKGDMQRNVQQYAKILLCLAKMVPDEICCIESVKAELIAALDLLVEKSTSKSEIKELVAKIIDELNDPAEWYNTDKEFQKDTADKSIFEMYYENIQTDDIRVPEILTK